MSQQLNEAGYDTKELGKRRRRSMFRRFGRVTMFVLIVAGLGLLAADYLARLPRERHAINFGYSKRVWLGAKKAFHAAVLTIQSYQDDPKSSKLPRVELYIKGKRLDKLNSSLPESGSDYQKAEVMIDNEVYSAEVRYRGDSINHWAFPNKSWRIQLRKGKQHDGMNVMNLTVPRTETQLSNWLGYQMIGKFDDVLFPDASFVHFRLNRKFDGVRLFLEQPDQDFLRRRNLPFGKIFVGDIDSAQIYGDVERKRLYQDPTAWTVRGPVEDASTNEISALISIIKNENTPYRFYYAMQDLVDMRSLLKYMAMLELVGSVHVDETHNGKFYFHPTKGKFMPIAWDTVAYMWKNTKGMDLGSNSLFRTVLSNPEFRERKDRFLWNAIHGSLSAENMEKLVTDAVNRLRPDLYSFALKIAANDKGLSHISNERWEQSVKELKAIIKERHAMFQRELENSQAYYRLLETSEAVDFSGQDQGLVNSNVAAKANYMLGVQIPARAGYRLDTLELDSSAPEGSVVKLARRGLDDLLHPVKTSELLKSAVVRKGKVRFHLGDALYSKRRFTRKRGAEIVPSNYVYLIDAPKGSLLKAHLKGTSTVTGGKIIAEENESLAIEQAHRENIVWWEPTRLIERGQHILEGNVHLTKDLLVDGFTNLLIKAGTQIEMDPGVSIFVHGGSLVAQGTAEQPIIFRGTSPTRPWGVIAVQDGALSKISHVSITGGSEDRSKFVRYAGSLSVHGGSAEIDHLKIEGSYLSVRDTELVLKDSLIRNILPFYLQSERSVLRQEHVEHEQISPVHSKARLSGPAFGTPARAEREFKWTVDTGNTEMSLEELSQGILEALKLSVSDGQWEAPKHAGNQYYVDDEVKDFAFRDIYFDTPDNLNYKHHLSYRFRNRYSNSSGYKIHTKNPQFTSEWPYRLEFQAKYDRKELGEGFSTVDEARFEFRKESKPFSEDNLPPPPPWDLDEYIPYFEAGAFKGLPALPAKAVMEFYERQGVTADELAFSPRLVLMTERFRQHLNIKSPWGSGPNPEQSFIISLDSSEVYGATSYLKFLKRRTLGDKKAKAPDEIGRLIEIEIEFERNVSDVLDQKIRVAKESGDTATLEELKAAREAFISDQKRIMTVVKDYFDDRGVNIYPASKSKYVQAFELGVLGALPKRADAA